MACKSPSGCAYATPDKVSLAVPGFEIDMRRTRGVPLRLPPVFLFEFSFLAVPGLEIDTCRIRGLSITDVSVCFSAVFLFEFSSLGRVTSDRVCGG